MSHLLYLDVDTLSGSAFSAQFPLDKLCLCWLIPFARSDVLLPHGEEEENLDVYPHLSEILWESSEEEHHLSNPISLSVPMSATPPHLEEDNQMEGGPCHHPASTQTEGGLGYHPASSFCRTPIKREHNWNMSLSRRHRSWLKDTSITKPNKPGM